MTEAKEKAKKVLDDREDVETRELEDAIRAEQDSRADKYSELYGGVISREEYLVYRNESLGREKELEARLLVARGKNEGGEIPTGLKGWRDYGKVNVPEGGFSPTIINGR